MSYPDALTTSAATQGSRLGLHVFSSNILRDNETRDRAALQPILKAQCSVNFMLPTHPDHVAGCRQARITSSRLFAYPASRHSGSMYRSST
jgi:hypothetical protein